MFHISIQNRSGRIIVFFKQIGLLFFMCYVKEGVSQGFKSWAVLNIMPFLKGCEDSFVKRPHEKNIRNARYFQVKK